MGDTALFATNDWVEQTELYSDLSHPATLPASERVLSVAGNTITEKHSSLTDKNAENTTFLHSIQ